ncbi:MAG TPA: flippase activity-associated protein Agl23 [Chloroflexia bacterium]|nr:flippase activity-associated protein Agl23 [Chloroflexia bacterium]
MSASAEYGAPRSARVPAAEVSLLDRAVDLTRANWEVIFFVGIMALAVLTRVWDLGARAMHHDEGIHAYFSHHYLRSGDYTTSDPARFQGGYDPTYHGPFLYHIVGLSFWLFGTTDATARLMPALFGVVLIGLIWLLRPFIGRLAALIAAVLVLISPTITYYSRSLRHDIFALAGALLLFASILWFLRTHQSRWVFLGAVGLIVAYASHELTFIIAFVFTLFLLLAALLYNTFSGSGRDPDRRTSPEDDVNPVRSALSSLGAQRWTLVGAALLALGIYFVLYTNLLTKPQLAFSGVIEGLNYWLGQHGEARGDQPWFYYSILMPIYEPLALFAGLGTVVYMLVKWVRGTGDHVIVDDRVDAYREDEEAPAEDEYGYRLPAIEPLRGLTLAFLTFWSFSALVAFSMAGEKMPWLNMQIALPFSLLAAVGLSHLITSVDWHEARKGGALILGVGMVLFIVVAFVLMAFLTGNMPDPVGASADIQRSLRAVLLFVIAVGLLGLLGWLAYRMMPGRAIRVIGLTFAVILLVYGLRSMMLVSFRHGDVPNEMLVYTQSSRDTLIVADMVKRLSRDETAFDADRSATDVTGGRGLTIAMEQHDAIEWPFDWYFREMKRVSYHNPDAWKNNSTSVPPNVAVIFASEQTEAEPNFQAFIKDKYSTNRYVLNWWFPEDNYKVNSEGDIAQAWSWLTGGGWKYILYRDPGRPLGSRNFYLHVRNDLAAKVGLGAPTGAVSSGGTSTGGPTEGGPVYDMVALAPTGAERGQFNLPRGIATGPDGAFYVVDTGNMRVQKFGSDGTFSQIIGNGRGNGDGQFNSFSDTASGTGPGGVAVDSQGNIYVADTWNHRVQKFGPDGRFLMKWGEFVNLSDAQGAADANRNNKFFGPRGIAVDAQGNVYVTDTGNKRVSIFDGNGRFLREISSGVTPEKTQQGYAYNAPGELNEPIGIAVDAQGNVYVADTNNRRFQKFGPDGKFVAQWAVPQGGWGPGPYLEPFLAVDAQGNVYASDPTGAKVYKFNPDGQLQGEKNTSPQSVALKTPTGLAVASDGRVYVVDTGSHGVVNMGTIP